MWSRGRPALGGPSACRGVASRNPCAARNQPQPHRSPAPLGTSHSFMQPRSSSARKALLDQTHSTQLTSSSVPWGLLHFGQTARGSSLSHASFALGSSCSFFWKPFPLVRAVMVMVMATIYRALILRQTPCQAGNVLLSHLNLPLCGGFPFPRGSSMRLRAST